MKIFVLVAFYVAWIGSLLPTFRNTLSVQGCLELEELE